MLNKIDIGILALQGGVTEHQIAMEELHAQVHLILEPKDLCKIDGLIIPGGESTTMSLLIDRYRLREPLRKRIIDGMPTWGTCAGMVLLSRHIIEGQPKPLNVIDMVVSRNAFGRQIDSFETQLLIEGLGDSPLQAIFIRAPVVTAVGTNVRTLGCLPDGRAVAVQQGLHMATAFHPELTNDRRFHRKFLQTVLSSIDSRPDSMKTLPQWPPS